MERKFFKFITTVLLLITIVVACNKEPVTGVKLDKQTLFLAVGATATLKAEIIPHSAINKTVNWTTSNNNIVAVEGISTEAIFAESLVTGKGEGEATITVTTEDGKFTATCRVTVIKVEPEMALVESGDFIMGCTDEQGDNCSSNELPTRRVTLDGFYIAKYPVTQREWRAIMGSPRQDDEYPIESVNWNEAQVFIAKLNAATGKKYRLPTEAEWEYAARGGHKSEGFKYSGSNNPSAVGWYKENNIGDWTQPVGRKDPNELGIYDMSGNVWEWCLDWYNSDYYKDAPQINPTGPLTGTLRVIRGGCIQNNARAACVFARGRLNPNVESRSSAGFRLVHPLEP
ncbi:MAG: SUMF1/EgtB/PvdO family nonheme iron enzyme [Bacteroidetes bacterium]|nr:SUMF1/EgtB/PvdO family nonheme iron enzyme [Bacteroidota bacterium]MCL2302430.1 SUMF1/EgtB/PvdO family nonheme iron enzyme [Lentimicrobiaceae bacterium]